MSPILSSCLKKKAYTEGEALALVECSREPGLAAYKCPIGGHYHIGHRRSRSFRKQGKKPRKR
jgi:hypothetical protein